MELKLSRNQYTNTLKTTSTIIFLEITISQNEHSETAVNKENDSVISKEESIDSKNEEDKMTAYITKIPEFNGEDIETSPQEWLDQVCPHAPEDLNSAIQHAKRYKMAMEEANHTKLVNLAIGETSSTAEEKIDQLAKKVENYFTNQQLQPPQRYQPPQRWNQNNFNFHYTALLEGRAAARQQNPSYTPITIPPARIAKNANLSDIFSFEFEANKSPFLLSNAAANEQKAITAMYTKAKVEGKPIHLILDSGSTGSIITYQLMQQLKRNIDRPAQTIIVTADGMKKTPVGEIDNFLFTIDGITIPVKVLVMDALQYQALVRNNWLQKANANLNWETQELTISYQGQHAQVPATCGTFNKCSEKAPAFEFKPEEEKPIIKTFMALGSTSNWAEETEQKHFTPHSESETPGWNIPYSKPKPRKQHSYILLKCKNCHKKLLSGKWNRTPCLTCGKQLPNECDWIDVAFKEGICNQTCQYALSIAEKIKCETSFNATYNSALSKLYHYPHDAEMIYELAMVLINGGAKENVLQIKEAEYIEYTLELAGFDYEDEDEVKVYHQIASHTYPTQEAQIQ
ncbi:hypothetical protein G9A89_018958 [Geosiphon pyriformis]|nr:hypothetical protein G9A89_018958 [Geosiphon pyriformis]